ncbi:MAG: phospho-sugar mutase [Flavobacteriales bacterium]|nr:phospho-sugar mutase [Flavobacteriales bacterium]
MAIASETEHIEKKALEWLKDGFDEETKKGVQSLLDSEDPTDLIDSFYKNLEFGTGGLRGKMGVGTNKMNKYTVGWATQGLANYLKKEIGSGSKVAIAFDSRNNSTYFANVVAEVLSANDIEVFKFKELRPTPLLSYAVRALHCNAGIVITASHNPKEYNGYKVYWNDGGQLVPPHDKGIISEVKQLNEVKDINFEFKSALIQEVPASVEDQYWENVLGIARKTDSNKDLKVVYTALHGTGITMIPEGLEKLGYEQLHLVESQKTPNGDFPTVKSPNPEEKVALEEALQLGKSVNADIVLGTDPDTDRVGIAVPNLEGNLQLLNGNQAASVLVYYILKKNQDSGLLNDRQFTCKTVVTSELIRKISESFNVPCEETLTGFKYIAEKIRLNEGKRNFLVGGEESYGYLVGDFVRDKDAVISALFLVEIASWCKENGTTFFELLLDVYEQYGAYQEDLVSLVKEGKKGAEEIAHMMSEMRENPWQEICGIEVKEIWDFSNAVKKDLGTNSTINIDFPKSNVLQYRLIDGSIITARPSGTEPKIKFYISVNESLESKSNYTQVRQKMIDKIDAFKGFLGI